MASTERARRPFPAIVNVNHLIRLLRLLLRPRGPIISPLLPCRTHFRVGPTDLDILGHVNNGKYFSLMDLARVDLIARAGLLPHLRRRGWVPVVVAETIQLRRSLSLFQAFVIHTRVLGWDDKAFVLDQHFERGTRSSPPPSFEHGSSPGARAQSRRGRSSACWTSPASPPPCPRIRLAGTGIRRAGRGRGRYCSARLPPNDRMMLMRLARRLS